MKIIPQLPTVDNTAGGTDGSLKPVTSNVVYDHTQAADPHTGYQKESLLTTQGDIAYATGASTWARLAKGTGAQPLVMNSGATAPQWGLINRLAGVLGVAAGFDTAPTTLANATDGDWTTSTGIGENAALAAWTSGGSIVWDMGAVYTVLLCGRIIVGDNNAGGVSHYISIAASPDNSAWVFCGDNTDGNSWSVGKCYNADASVFPPTFIVRNRYIRLRSVNAGTQKNVRMGITELVAIDLAV